MGRQRWRRRWNVRCRCCCCWFWIFVATELSFSYIATMLRIFWEARRRAVVRSELIDFWARRSNADTEWAGRGDKSRAHIQTLTYHLNNQISVGVCVFIESTTCSYWNNQSLRPTAAPHQRTRQPLGHLIIARARATSKLCRAPAITVLRSHIPHRAFVGFLFIIALFMRISVIYICILSSGGIPLYRILSVYTCCVRDAA